MRLRPLAPAARGVRPTGSATALLALVLLAGCGSGDAARDARSAEPATSESARSESATSDPASPGPEGAAAPDPSTSGAAGSAERVRAVLDGVELSLEVADDEQERAVGLMRRTSVPPGTGMVFRYDGLSNGRYYMFQVPVPLRAVFVRDGRVVSTTVMPPCEEPVPDDCPTYGADSPYDTVVETAPETLPDVQPGDVLELEG